MKTSIDVRNMCEEHQIKMIDFKMIDINGRWHHVTIPVARFTEDIFTYGIGFDVPTTASLLLKKAIWYLYRIRTRRPWIPLQKFLR